MAIFEGILDRIRTKKKEMVLSSHDAYYELLKDVASGKECDADEAARVLDAAGKTEDQFEADVNTMQNRFELAQQLIRKVEIQRQIPKLEDAEQMASDHYEKVVRPASEKLDAARRAKRAAENELLLHSQVESKLAVSCLNASLIMRENELIALRKELQSKRQPLFEDLSHSRNVISSFKSSVESLSKKCQDKENYHPVGRAAYKKDLEKTELRLEREIQMNEQLSKAVGQLDAELAPLDAEMKVLADRKLVP